MSCPDNPTEQEPTNLYVNFTVVDPSADYEKLKAEYEETKNLLDEAIRDAKAFIHQLDRHGVGMQTVIDHRTRVDKFFSKLKKLGRE
jgi:hypothetical protein